MKEEIRCAVVGVGYLGKFHAEKYASHPRAQLVAVCDIDHGACHEVARKHRAQATDDYSSLLGQVDAVSIATPTTTHHTIAKFFLENGVHVLVEKPITSTVAEAEDLIAVAKKTGCILQVGHLERFNSVINVLTKYIDNPRFIESSRLAPFKPRSIDVNVVLDLMIHDIDLIQFLVNSPIKKIHANGTAVLSNHIDIANAYIEFENNCVANVTASRVSLHEERKLRLFQKQADISLDLQHKTIAFQRIGENEMFPGIPEIVSEEQAFEHGDALRDEIGAFIDAIIHDTPPVVSGQDGKNALATAMEITNIVKRQMELQETMF